MPYKDPSAPCCMGYSCPGNSKNGHERTRASEQQEDSKIRRMSAATADPPADVENAGSFGPPGYDMVLTWNSLAWYHTFGSTLCEACSLSVTTEI